MCFGNMEETRRQTTSSTQTTSPPAWVEQAGQSNYDIARSILDRGYQPYEGQRVAPLSADETAAADLIRGKASSANPWEGIAETAFGTYGSTPGYNFDFNTIVDETGPLGSIQSYITPYLQQVLDPTLRQIGLQGAQARNAIGAGATMSGAFGDARHGVVESEQMRNQGQLEADVTGKTWADAFAQALGLRTGDAGRLFQTQQAQAGEDRATLDRMRTSGIDLTNLDKYGVSRDLSLSSALGGAGESARKVEQAKADADYQEHLAKSGGWDMDMVKQLTAILAGTPTTKTTTGESVQSREEPNNSGWQAVGTLASALLLSDRRAKTDIARVGALDDGTPVYRFRYRDGGPVQIGLMAQDIERGNPAAVTEIEGIKYLDYGKATDHLVGDHR